MSNLQNMGSLPTETIQTISSSLAQTFKSDRVETDDLAVTLDRDPSSKSPSVLYLKLYEAREHSNRIGVIFMKFLKMHVFCKKLLLEKEEERNRILNRIYVDNADYLKTLRSSDEKTRVCESLIDKDFEDSYIECKILQEQASGYYVYFKHRFDFIKSVKDDILIQLGVIKSMMQLGELPILNDLNEVLPDVELGEAPELKEGTVSF